MLRRTRVAQVAALSLTLAAIGLRSTASAQTAPTCFGQPATTTVGTPGDDVIVGTEGADQINAGAGHDFICGLGGDDLLAGQGGPDSISGGRGNDNIDGGLDADFLRGDLGLDTAFYDLQTSRVAVDLGQGVATVGQVIDHLASIESILGTPFDDELKGSVRSEFFSGYGGDDVIVGRGGLDTALFPDAPRGIDANLATGEVIGQATTKDSLYHC